MGCNSVGEKGREGRSGGPGGRGIVEGRDGSSPHHPPATLNSASGLLSAVTPRRMRWDSPLTSFPQHAIPEAYPSTLRCAALRCAALPLCCHRRGAAGLHLDHAQVGGARGGAPRGAPRAQGARAGGPSPSAVLLPRLALLALRPYHSSRSQGWLPGRPPLCGWPGLGPMQASSQVRARFEGGRARTSHLLPVLCAPPISCPLTPAPAPPRTPCVQHLYLPQSPRAKAAAEAEQTDVAREMIKEMSDVSWEGGAEQCSAVVVG